MELNHGQQSQTRTDHCKVAQSRSEPQPAQDNGTGSAKNRLEQAIILTTAQGV